MAKKTRAKEILLFFSKYSEKQQLLFNVLDILVQGVAIEKKWYAIEKLFSAQDFVHPKFLENNKNREFIEEFVLFVQLLFLDQTKEVPPPNLKLHFVHQKFPRYNWEVTDCSENLNNQEWNCKDEYCNVYFLNSCLWKLFYQQIVPTKSTSVEPDNVIKIDHPLKLNYLEMDKAPQLFEDDPTAILSKFIQNINGKSNYAINHLLAILLQIQQNYKKGQCFFDWDYHFRLILNPTVKKNIKKQLLLAEEIFSELKKLQAVRLLKINGATYESHSYLINTLDYFYNPEEKHLKQNLQKNKMNLKIDPCLVPSANNPLKFAAALRLLPVKLLQETVKTYPFLLSLCLYLYDGWLDEYPKLKGKLTRRIDQLIIGSCIKVPKSGKYRIIQRVRSALNYLKQKNYISNYQINYPPKDTTEAIYLISAPAEFHKSIDNNIGMLSYAKN